MARLKFLNLVLVIPVWPMSTGGMYLEVGMVDQSDSLGPNLNRVIKYQNAEELEYLRMTGLIQFIFLKVLVCCSHNDAKV
jgi:hypothetical protein